MHDLLVPRPWPRKLSIVVPMYNEERIVPLFRAAAQSFVDELPCETEIVLVNDGSKDSTIEQRGSWALADHRIKVIHLSRNFGHQIAATVGLDHASGDAIVLTDADLQDPFSVIHEMIDRYCEGYDVAYGQREVRKGETWFKLSAAWVFYRLMRFLVYKDLPVDTGDFRLISRECLDGLSRMRETHRFLRGMVRYRRAPRAAGETKYPIRKLLSLAWNAATSFSTVPLGLSFAFALLAYGFGWYTVSGWTSITVIGETSSSRMAATERSAT